MDKQNETPATSPVQHEMKEFLAGFERVEAEVRAVPERDLVLVNLDVPSAVATALGSWPEIVQRREEVAALKGADIAKFDKIRDYAFALGHAHSEYRAALGPADPIGTLAEEVTEAREQLFADGKAWAGAACSRRVASRNCAQVSATRTWRSTSSAWSACFANARKSWPARPP